MVIPFTYMLGMILILAPVSIIKGRVVAPSLAATSKSGESVGAYSDRPLSLTLIEQEELVMTI